MHFSASTALHLLIHETRTLHMFRTFYDRLGLLATMVYAWEWSVAIQHFSLSRNCFRMEFCCIFVNFSGTFVFRIYIFPISS
jgi:hypothetical protein